MSGPAFGTFRNAVLSLAVRNVPVTFASSVVRLCELAPCFSHASLARLFFSISFAISEPPKQRFFVNFPRTNDSERDNASGALAA